MKVIIIFSLFLFSTSVFAWCTGRGDCCRCPGQAQDLGSHATCEQACGGGKGSSGSSSYSTGKEIGTIIGNELGDHINKALFGDPEEEAREAARVREAARIQAENNARFEAEKEQKLELQKNRLMDGMIGMEESAPLALMTDNQDSSLVPMPVPEVVKDCSTPAIDVSSTLHKFNLEAKTNAYTFIASDIGNEVLSMEALQGTSGQEYREMYDKTKTNVRRLKGFDEELGKIQACLKLQKCDLIELNKKINAEFAIWLKEQLNQGTQNAIDRVKSAKKFLQGYVKRINTANEKLLKASTSCKN